MKVEVEGGIARLWFERPEAGNAIDVETGRALREKTAVLEGRDDVRAVVLGGDGHQFCVGGDIAQLATAEGLDQALGGLAEDCHAALLSLRSLDAPVVAQVNGPAAGIGLSFVLAADIVVAVDTAHFTTAYTALGFTPDGGQTWTLPRIIGIKRATELLLTNRRVSARDALALGVVTEVVTAQDLDARVRDVVERLATGPMRTFGALKRLLEASAESGFADHLELEAASIAAMAGSPSGREGVAAFLEKRPPAF